MIEGPENLPDLRNLSLPDRLDRILALADQISGLRSDREAMVKEIIAKYNAIVENEMREGIALGALKHTISARPLEKVEKELVEAGKTEPVKPVPAGGGCGRAKTGLMLVALTGLSVAVGTGYSLEEKPMGKSPVSALVAGREAIKELNWVKAEKLFADARVPGSAGEAECLFRIVECRVNLKNYAGALETCVDLDLVTGGDDPRVAMWRGKVHRDRGNPGDKELAKSWLAKSAAGNCTAAKTLLARME